MKDNWYIVLELEFDPNPEHDPNNISQRIDEKVKYWRYNLDSFDTDKSQLYRSYLDRQDVIRAAMKNTKERERLINEACEIAAPVDKLIKMAAPKGEITQNALQLIAASQNIEEDFVVNRIIALGVPLIDDDTATSLYGKIRALCYEAEAELDKLLTDAARIRRSFTKILSELPPEPRESITPPYPEKEAETVPYPGDDAEAASTPHLNDDTEVEPTSSYPDEDTEPALPYPEDIVRLGSTDLGPPCWPTGCCPAPEAVQYIELKSEAFMGKISTPLPKYVFGIDLGATHTSIAYVDEKGHTVVVDNSEGQNATPSVVHFSSPDEVVVGQVAKEVAAIEPETTIAFVKRLMGRANTAIHYNGNNISPEEVSAYILKKVTTDADSALWLEQNVIDVVITVPSYFGAAQRMATREAGIIAGLNVLDIINEPSAAALYYDCLSQESKTVLVYSLGGAYFDATVVSIGDNEMKIVSTDGYDIGGNDWDDRLISYLLNEYAAQTGNYYGEQDEHTAKILRLKAENAKHQLTHRESTNVLLESNGVYARINVTRATFDEITQMLLLQTFDATDRAIEEAAEKGHKIDEIILSGGSTAMPQVIYGLAEKYGIKPRTMANPREAVARGAAIHANNILQASTQTKID